MDFPSNSAQPQQEGAFVKKSIQTPNLDQVVTLSGSAVPQASQGFFRANRYYFLAIIIGAAIIATLSYFAFHKTPAVAPKEANVSISVDVPQTVPSGSEAVYKITIQNNDSQKLVNQQLELTYDDGMAYDNSTPSANNYSGTLFSVPDLIPGQNASVFVKIKVSGNVNDQKTLNLKLHYHLANFNSEFTQQQSAVVQLVASDLVLQLQGPDTTNNAQLIIYTVTYQNNSGQDIKNARIKMSYPDGFSFSSATPPPDLGSDTWSLPALTSGGGGTIQIQGNFNSSNPGETKTAMVQFLVFGSDGQYFTQNSASFNTAISSLPLLVSQQLSPANSDGVVSPGDTLNFSLTYQNNANTPVSGVVVEANLTSKSIDFSTVRAQGGQVNNNTIIWNAANLPQLASLLPNQSGQLTFSFKLNNPASLDSSKNLTVVSNIKISAKEYTTPFPGGPLTLKISSPASISPSLSFVSGQMPPRVGQETVYQVRLALSDFSNDLSSGVLEADVPVASGGFVQGSVSSAEAGNVQFDSAKSHLVWNVGNLAANTGRFSQPRVLEFQIKISPSSTQVNQSPSLLKNIVFNALDNFTGRPVSASARDLTTGSLPSSAGSYGNGTVQP